MAWNREPLRNEFSWSKSRHEKFKECARAYYYHYYGSWGGWERNAADETRELYLLKKLTSRHAWAGSSVHDAIAKALGVLRAGETPDAERMIAQVRDEMRAQFRLSRDGAYRKRKAFGLVEHEYAEPIEDEEWRSFWTLVEACLTAFFGSRFPNLAAGLAKELWLPIDQLGSFFFDGVKIYAAPDFAYRTPEGGAVLIDWKTGQQRESNREQLLGYAMYARDIWDVPIEKVECRVVYLPSMAEDEVHVDAAEVDAFCVRMRASIDRMLGLLEDREANVAVISRFPETDDPRVCQRCAFRRPCKGIGA